jgi:hypothetical protein
MLFYLLTGCSNDSQISKQKEKSSILQVNKNSTSDALPKSEQIAISFINELNQQNYVVGLGVISPSLNKDDVTKLMGICDGVKGTTTSDVSMYSQGQLSWFGSDIITCQIPLVFKFKSVQGVGDKISLIYTEEIENSRVLPPNFITGKNNFVINGWSYETLRRGAMVFKIDIHSSAIDDEVKNINNYTTLISKSYDQ